MIEKLKQLLTPDVDLSVKLATVAALLGRKAVEHDSRIVSLEARQLQKGDKGDRGEKGDSVDPEEVSTMIYKLFKNKEKSEDEDLRVLMGRTWETW